MLTVSPAGLETLQNGFTAEDAEGAENENQGLLLVLSELCVLCGEILLEFFRAVVIIRAGLPRERAKTARETQRGPANASSA
jgi:hypothetical protein